MRVMEGIVSRINTLNKMRENKKRGTALWLATLTGLLVTGLLVGSVSAYFTDGDTVTNTFTVGKISLELQEPDWDPEAAKNMTPNQTVRKNPQIYNDGINSEFVFMEVTLPYAYLVTANEDGTLNEAKDTELYCYTVNPGWHQMSVTKDSEYKTVTYLYVYGDEGNCTELGKEETTPTLFDQVKLVNMVEDQDMEGQMKEILINAYGIQTSNINGGKTSPADVWAVLYNQKPSTDK